MATIIGGIAASHTPTIGFAFDHDKRNDPVWGVTGSSGHQNVASWVPVRPK